MGLRCSAIFDLVNLFVGSKRSRFQLFQSFEGATEMSFCDPRSSILDFPLPRHTDLQKIATGISDVE